MAESADGEELRSTAAHHRETAEHHIAELVRFFRWLNRTDQYGSKSRRISTNLKYEFESPHRSGRPGPLHQVDRYTLDELVLLNKYATPLERLLLLLGINCGFGAAEQGRLTMGHLFLHQHHPHADLIRRVYGVESGPHDSHILAARPKNGVYGEWYLWPQTVEVLKWARQKRERIGSATADSVLVVNERGRPFFHQTAGGNRVSVQSSLGRSDTPHPSRLSGVPVAPLRQVAEDGW